MTTRVKICGITDDQSLQAAAQAGADWIGLVFFAASPRFLTPQAAASLLARHEAPLPNMVGLFVKASDHEIAATLAAVPIDTLQIYDTVERAHAIKRRFSLPVWFSCSVTSPSDLPTNAEFDRYVIEPRPSPQMTRPGGNGQTLDWTLLRDWRAPSPWMLAGGLGPETVATAIQQSGAPAVDVSSGVEKAPGQKSPELIRNFIKNARSSCANSGS